MGDAELVELRKRIAEQPVLVAMRQALAKVDPDAAARLAKAEEEEPDDRMIAFLEALEAVWDTALERKDAEIARLRDYARKVSIALTSLSGGGSEMFTRIGEDFFADPEACRQRVEDKIATARKLARSQALSEDHSHA